MTDQSRQALKNITNQQLQAGEEYFQTDDHNALKKTTAEPKPNPAPKQAAGAKRKSTESGPSNVNFEDIDVVGMYIDKSCNQVRGQIRRFIESGEMKVGEFCKAIDVSNKSLNDFLRQNGPMKGSGSATYHNAFAFFKKRELAGLKMPTKKAKTTVSGKSAGTANAAAKVDISNVRLDGEEECDVAVYDTCDEIRKKINAHLMKDGVTQAQFCRDLTAQMYGTATVAARQLTTFRGKKGANAGATSSVFYASYVFFEKIRLSAGKPKSKHRLEMEDAWPKGFDLECDANTRYWCAGSERPREDRLGRITFQ